MRYHHILYQKHHLHTEVYEQIFAHFNHRDHAKPLKHNRQRTNVEPRIYDTSYIAEEIIFPESLDELSYFVAQFISSMPMSGPIRHPIPLAN
jgi:hypothetical protein